MPIVAGFGNFSLFSLMHYSILGLARSLSVSSKGKSPMNNWYIIPPALQTSHFKPYLLPSSTYGAMYDGLPAIVSDFSLLMSSFSNILANPKSETLSYPLLKRMFSGFISRWMIPFEWRKLPQLRSCLAKESASLPGMNECLLKNFSRFLINSVSTLLHSTRERCRPCWLTRLCCGT